MTTLVHVYALCPKTERLLGKLSYFDVRRKRLTRRKCKSYLKRKYSECKFKIEKVWIKEKHELDCTLRLRDRLPAFKIPQ